MPHLLKGLVIGFSIAAPVGPVGLLCIRRSLNHGRTVGFVSGLGAATADTIYGLVAALGLTAVTRVLVEHHSWFQLGGGIFLVLVGLATVRSRPPAEAARVAEPAGLPTAFVSTMMLTLLNPMTILSFIGIFAGLGINAGAGGWKPATWLVAGVFLGSAVWWLLLSTAAGWFRAHLQSGGLRGLNLVSGIIIAAFGAWELIGLAWR